MLKSGTVKFFTERRGSAEECSVRRSCGGSLRDLDAWARERKIDKSSLMGTTLLEVRSPSDKTILTVLELARLCHGKVDLSLICDM